MGLTDVDKPVEIKVGAAELAVALSDALDAIKNAGPAYKQLVTEHTALKATKTEHQGILDDNQRLLERHHAGVVAFRAEQKKTEEANKKASDSLVEREKEVQRQQNAITAREDAVKRREKQAAETASVQAQKDEQHKKQHESLLERETAVKNAQAQVEKDRNEIKATQDELTSVIARRKA